jgi:hypothetical protein
MGVKRGIKRSRVYAITSSSSSEASTLPPSSPPSSPLPASLPKGSSQGPPSKMYKHDKPSKGFLVVDLGSEIKDKDFDGSDTSRDEEMTHKLFNDLNQDLLGPLDDGKVIVINDSNITMPMSMLRHLLLVSPWH